MKRFILLCLVLFLFLAGFALYQYLSFYDGKLHVVFCDVGQGDAVLITTPRRQQVLIDAGPDSRVMGCLSRHMPFWDRTIEIVMMTHPHADHITGLVDVLSAYRVNEVATIDVTHNSDVYQAIMAELERQQIKKRIVVAGDTYRFADGVILAVTGPREQLLSRIRPASGLIGEMEAQVTLASLITYKNIDVLLTGDNDAAILEDALLYSKVENVSVMQVPHHGSKNGLNRSILDRLNPEVAIISVGADNRFGHPAKEAMDLLSAKRKEQSAIQILQTDVDGEVEVVSDGREDWIIRH